MTRKHNHMLDIAFTVISDQESWEQLTDDEILDALQNRLDYLRSHINEVSSSVGHCDSYSFDELKDDANG